MATWEGERRMDSRAEKLTEAVSTQTAVQEISSEESLTADALLKRPVTRRSFLQALGAAGAGLAFFSGGRAAAHGWNMGILGSIPDDKLVDFYTKMLRIRWWEEKIKDAFLEGKDGLYGALHLYVGEEAVAVGAIGALNNDDYIASTHRGHGHLIAKGGDLRRMSAEIYFKETGYNKGFGGSMHIADMSKGILGMNGIIGPSYLLCAGAAYGAKVRGTKQVAMAFGGDGSVQNGWFWSAMRNAALYKLPLVAVVENNGWQISTPVENSISVSDLSRIVSGLDIPGYTVDGTDVLAVYDVTRRAVERARAGEGPTLIEAKTYRWYDHAGLAGARVGEMGAFGLPYRSDREVRAWMTRDPIAKLRQLLVSESILSEDQANQIERDVIAEVVDSIEFARQSPHPKPDAALEHVFAEGRVRASQFWSA